jgi:predicted dehydrogenase
MSNRSRWGILGAASIAPAVIEGIRMGETGEVRAVASRDLGRAKSFAAKHDIPRAFGSYDELLRSGEVDIMYNPLPNSLHAEWTIKALEAGLPVLCEKPFTATTAEARTVAEVSRRVGVPVAEAFMYRFHPVYDEVMALVLQGAIGELQLIESCFTFYLEDRTGVAAAPELAGGALMDVGCYCVNFARLITGAEPSAAIATEKRTNVDDTFAGVLEFADGVLAQVQSSIGAHGRARAEIVGTQGAILLENPWFPGEEAGEIVLRRGTDTERIRTRGANCYHLETEDFALAVREKRPPRWTVDDAIANMAAIEALAASARTGAAVAINIV